MEVTQEVLDSTFPNGVIAWYDTKPDAHTRRIVGLQVKQVEGGKIIALGWTPPNKDMYFDLTDVKELAPDRWQLRAWGEDTRVVFNPLPKKLAQETRAAMY